MMHVVEILSATESYLSVLRGWYWKYLYNNLGFSETAK